MDLMYLTFLLKKWNIIAILQVWHGEWYTIKQRIWLFFLKKQ